MIARARSWCHAWSLWRVPRPVLVLVLVVDALAVIVAACTAFLVPVGLEDLVRFGILACCSFLATELTRHIEQRRSFAHQTYSAHVDNATVWMFASVLVLPPALASSLVVLNCYLIWCRVKKGQAVPYRRVYSAATVLLGAQVAVLILYAGMHSYPGIPISSMPRGILDLGVVVLAGLVSWAINYGLVVAALALFNPTVRASDLTDNFSEQLQEAGGVALGLLAAVAVVTNPIILAGVVVVIVALHRGLLVSQYEHASRIDTKTGLATAGRWHDFAEEMLARARHRQTNLGLLMMDLDHFKGINDTYGHPFGDMILKAAGEELRSEVRELDACGRWGGEEFTIVVADIDDQQSLHGVAERIRRRIEAMAVEAPGGNGDGAVPVSASVGGIFYTPDTSATLDELILAADAALYEAKNSGRNTVRVNSVVVDHGATSPTQGETTTA